MNVSNFIQKFSSIYYSPSFQFQDRTLFWHSLSNEWRVTKKDHAGETVFLINTNNETLALDVLIYGLRKDYDPITCTFHLSNFLQCYSYPLYTNDIKWEGRMLYYYSPTKEWHVIEKEMADVKVLIKTENENHAVDMLIYGSESEIERSKINIDKRVTIIGNTPGSGMRGTIKIIHQNGVDVLLDGDTGLTSYHNSCVKVFEPTFPAWSVLASNGKHVLCKHGQECNSMELFEAEKILNKEQNDNNAR